MEARFRSFGDSRKLGSVNISKEKDYPVGGKNDLLSLLIYFQCIFNVKSSRYTQDIPAMTSNRLCQLPAIFTLIWKLLHCVLDAPGVRYMKYQHKSWLEMGTRVLLSFPSSVKHFTIATQLPRNRREISSRQNTSVVCVSDMKS